MHKRRILSALGFEENLASVVRNGIENRVSRCEVIVECVLHHTNDDVTQTSDAIDCNIALYINLELEK